MSALERPPTQIILLLLLLQESKILSLSQAIHIFEASQCPFCAGSLSAPRLSYYHLSTNVQNFHLVEISPEQIKRSSALHIVQCTIVSTVFERSVCCELEIAECRGKPGHISRQIIITKVLHFVVGRQTMQLFVWAKIYRWSQKKMGTASWGLNLERSDVMGETLVNYICNN